MGVGNLSFYLRELRQSRAEPPGRAARDGERRAVYTAAVAQFEELLHAARAVGPRSRPLLLFYALSQGGRAIVAARGAEPRAFGHGLGEVQEGDPATPLLHRQIERRHTKRDLFGAVSRALGAPDFEGTVDLGAAWVAHPSLGRLPLTTWRPDWRLALFAEARQSSNVPTGMKEIRIMPFADPLEATAHHAPELLTDRYPTVPSDAEIVWKPPDVEPTGSWVAWLRLPDDEQFATRLNKIAPPIPLDRGHRYIPAALPGHSYPLPPLMLSWLLLFGLSIFARYHPELWARELDVDRSPVAVAIENVLAGSIETLPAMIYEAAYGL